MNPKKLLLVSANRHTIPYPVYPLGLSYIKTFLSEKLSGWEFPVFDFMNGSYEDYTRCLEETLPDYVGISIRNIDDVNIYRKESFIAHYRQIITLTRTQSKAKIIIGGSGFSIYPKLLFETLKPDFAIYGEGEISLNRLLDALENNKDFTTIDGLIFTKGDQVIVNERNQRFKQPVLNFENSLIDFYWQNSGMLNIQTKRGCPYHCIYCTYPLIEGHNVRTLDPGQIVETLTDLYRNKHIDYVFFTDSIFNISNDFNQELADRLIRRDLKIHWGGYFNFTHIDRRLLEKLKRAGLKHIEFGTESLSDTTLKSYGKPFTVADIVEICSLCNQLEIDFAHFLILGGYGETKESLAETFENSKRIARTVFFPFIGMRIYPGTQLQQIAIKENIISPQDTLLEPVYYVSKNIDLNSLKDLAKKTGRQWIFPDEDLSDIMIKMRKRNKKGPLWDYLIID